MEIFVKEHILSRQHSDNLKAERMEDLVEYFGRIVAPKIMPKSCPDYVCKKSIDSLFE